MIELGDLPQNTRIKLCKEDEEKLWENVEKEGINDVAKKTGYSRTKIYNWRSKNVFLPIEFVQEFLEDFQIRKLKGGSNSQPFRLNSSFQHLDEILTRINASVSVNKEGTPVYRTNEKPLLDRFKQLLEKLGEIPYKVYSRDAYELRYPKLLHQILDGKEYETDFPALFDEKGVFKNGEMVVENLKIGVEEFEGELYSIDKKYRLAIEKNDEEKVKEILQQSINRFQGVSSPED